MSQPFTNSGTAPVLRRCPHIGQFGFCDRTDCMANVGGPCNWQTENSQVVYTNNTGEANG